LQIITTGRQHLSSTGLYRPLAGPLIISTYISLMSVSHSELVSIWGPKNRFFFSLKYYFSSQSLFSCLIPTIPYESIHHCQEPCFNMTDQRERWCHVTFYRQGIMHRSIPEVIKINNARSKQVHAHLWVETHLNCCKTWVKDGMLMS
jgi:hypothetical protein